MFVRPFLFVFLAGFFAQLPRLSAILLAGLSKG
jgi:hypothetical protein